MRSLEHSCSLRRSLYVVLGMAETNTPDSREPAGRLLGPVISPPGAHASYAAKPGTSRGRFYPEVESATREDVLTIGARCEIAAVGPEKQSGSSRDDVAAACPDRAVNGLKCLVVVSV